MKRNIFMLTVFVLAVFFSSCMMKDNTGSICIRNEAEDNSLRIVGVYAKEKEQSVYSRIWTGNLAAGSSEFIRIDEGEYSVGIVVAGTCSQGCPVEWTTQAGTGYNVYKRVNSGNCIYVTFDGKGVFFE